MTYHIGLYWGRIDMYNTDLDCQWFLDCKESGMSKFMYSVFDSKAETWLPPFLANADGEAARMIAQAALHPDTSLAQYPDDYTLYRIGVFDNVSAAIECVSPPKHVANVVSLVQKAAMYTTVPQPNRENGNGTSVSDDTSVQSGSAGDDTAE